MSTVLVTRILRPKTCYCAFKHNEEVISTYLYHGLDEYRHLLDDKKDDQALIRDAANDSYRLFRKLGKIDWGYYPEHWQRNAILSIGRYHKILGLIYYPSKADDYIR